MKTQRCIVSSLVALMGLAFSGCADRERAIAGTGELRSIEERPSLSNPLKAEKGQGKRIARRNTGIASRGAR
jgi:hypothetical protein